MKKAGKNILKGLTATGAFAGILYGINTYIFKDSVKKEILKSDKIAYYNWKFGNIFYSRTGSGSPVLLIHDLSPMGSDHEWKNVIPKLAESHTVYTIDLPGCGRSDKEKMIYTNYIYIQAVNDFVKHVIREKADLITSGVSSSIAIMACNGQPDLYNKLILINPESLDRMIEKPSVLKKMLMRMIEIPIIGTSVYAALTSRLAGKIELKRKQAEKDTAFSDSTVDAGYEAAHLGGFDAKYAYASQIGFYTRVNVVPALKKIKNPVYLICGEKMAECDDIIDGYTHFVPSAESVKIHGSKGMPHIENANETARLCEIYLEDED